MILIVTGPRDSHANLVEPKLRARGARVVRFDWADIPYRASLSLTWSGGQRRVELATAEGKVDLRACTAAWLRRPGSARPSDAITDPFLRAYLEDEYLRLRNDLCNALEVPWLPAPPAVIQRADNKHLQLSLATELGWEIPPTLITNDPDELLAFYRAHDGTLIDKMPSVAFSGTQLATQRVIRYTQPVTARDIGYARRVRHSPMLFQRRIDKRFELRVTVVDDQVFAAEIHSQSTRRTQLDWRHYDWGHTPHRPHALPEEERARCVALCRRLGLRFGAIDLIVTPDDRYVFLEINPNGQWQWIEDEAGLPISDAVCEALVSSGPTRQ